MGIAMGYELDSTGSNPDRDEYLFSTPQRQTGSTFHPASHPVGTGGSFSGDKAIGA
jgi:hypothetical protein